MDLYVFMAILTFTFLWKCFLFKLITIIGIEKSSRVENKYFYHIKQINLLLAKCNCPKKGERHRRDYI